MTDSFLTDVIDEYCKKYKISKKVRGFWLRHPRCEICSLGSSHPHHIRTRGAGGDDEPVNLIALCTTHHTEIHQLGNETFSDRYPGVALKIKGGLERSRV